MALAVDRENQLWVGTTGKLLCYDAHLRPRDDVKIYHGVHCLFVDSFRTVWGGTMKTGLLRYAHGKLSCLRKSDGLASDTVFAIREDSEGSLWVGTPDGLTQIIDVKFPMYSTAEGLIPSPYHDTCVAAGGGVWAASSEGISWLDGLQVRNLGLEAGLKNVFTKRVYQSRDGDLYGIDGQMDIEILSGDKVVASYSCSNWPTALAEDGHGMLVSIADRLCRVSRTALVPYAFSGAPRTRRSAQHVADAD